MQRTRRTAQVGCLCGCTTAHQDQAQEDRLPAHHSDAVFCQLSMSTVTTWHIRNNCSQPVRVAGPVMERVAHPSLWTMELQYNLPLGTDAAGDDRASMLAGEIEPLVDACLAEPICCTRYALPYNSGCIAAIR